MAWGVVQAAQNEKTPGRLSPPVAQPKPKKQAKKPPRKHK